MCLSINLFSNRRPELLDTTGSSGTSPETAEKTNHRSKKAEIRKQTREEIKEENQSCGEETEEEEINWSSSWCGEVETRVLGFGEGNRKGYEVVKRETRRRSKTKIKTNANNRSDLVLVLLRKIARPSYPVQLFSLSNHLFHLTSTKI